MPDKYKLRAHRSWNSAATLWFSFVGVPEVTVEQVVHVTQVLHDDRFVEAILGVPGRDRLRRGTGTEDHDGGRREDGVQQDEDEDRDAGQDHQ